MSDYLADIAERSLTTEHAIRPRPQSAFEPFQRIAVSEPLQLPEVDQDYQAAAKTTRGVPSSQDVSSAITVQAQRLNVSDAIADPNPALTTPIEQSAGQDEYRAAAIQPLPEEAPSIQAKGTVSETISRASLTRKKFLPEPPDGLQTSSLSRPPARVKEVDRTVQEVRVPDHQPGTSVDIPEGNLIKPAIERVEVERPVPGQRQQQPVAPLASRLETIWEKKNDSMEKQASTPTIHVTIGRIEVRAISAPIQKQPKPQKPETMSLDEYLRRCDGGGR